jgi:hypothetical protein
MKAAKILVAFMAMIVVLSGCSEKSSVDLWVESLDEMKNGSLSFYMRSGALSVPKGTYDYIDVIEEIEENEDWSENMVFAQAMDGSYRLLFIHGDIARIQAERISRNKVKLLFDGEISAYESVNGLPWHRTDETDAVYKEVLMSTANVIDRDGSMIRRKTTSSLLNIITAQFKEIIQSFRNRLLMGSYEQGDYKKLKSDSGLLFNLILFAIFLLPSFVFPKAYYYSLTYRAKVRYVMTALLSCVAGITIAANANAMVFNWNIWLFERTLLLALVFFISSFFTKRRRIKSGLLGLISLVWGLVFGVLFITNIVMTLIALIGTAVLYAIEDTTKTDPGPDDYPPDAYPEPMPDGPEPPGDPKLPAGPEQGPTYPEPTENKPVESDEDPDNKDKTPMNV